MVLDFDLASLYGTETKYLKRSVKNNLKRFPSDFMFELTKEERDFLRCNFCTLKEGRGNHPTKHVCNIYLSEELYREATVSKMEIVRQEGNRSVRRILRKWRYPLTLVSPELNRLHFNEYTVAAVVQPSCHSRHLRFRRNL